MNSQYLFALQAGETPHRCDFCSKTFTRKEHLLNHVRQHTGESPHRCTYCPKTFTRKEHLTNHIHQHTGEAPSFQQWWSIMYGNLHAHTHTHQGGSCAQEASSQRREHVLQLTGESPTHRCRTCVEPCGTLRVNALSPMCWRYMIHPHPQGAPCASKNTLVCSMSCDAVMINCVVTSNIKWNSVIPSMEHELYHILFYDKFRSIQSSFCS